MKRLLTIVFALAILSAHAQKAGFPALKQGSKLTYLVNANGQEIPLVISFDSVTTDYVKLGWDIQGLGSGGWVMKKPSLESAKRWYWDQPMSGMDADIADDQAVLYLSKANWTALQKDKKIEIDQQQLSVATATADQQLKLNGASVDAILLQNESGSTKVWVLNNPTSPILLKIQGNMSGPDLEIRSAE